MVGAAGAERGDIELLIGVYDSEAAAFFGRGYYLVTTIVPVLMVSHVLVFMLPLQSRP
jgi:hypothetical protein